MTRSSKAGRRAMIWMTTPVVALLAVSATAQTRDAVLATFDTDGPYDHDALPKLETGPERLDAFEEHDAAPQRTALGGLGNQSCLQATEITTHPDFTAFQVTTSATSTVLCSPTASCGHSSGNTNQVFYRYTPDDDGYIDVTTYGSNYDTVLAIFDGCSSFFPSCNYPNELACSDNLIFGNQVSEILGFPVSGGSTYYILIADHGPTLGGGSMWLNLNWSPLHDHCSNAQQIPGLAYDPPLLSTHNAQPDLCEALESCEFNNVGVSNSVWYSYTPACDGTISMNTNGSTYDTVLSVHDGCGEFVAVDAPCALPQELDCDDDSGTGLQSQILDMPVSAGETLLIKVSDYNTSAGGGWLDFNFVFNGAEEPVAEITSPSGLSCVCGQVAITGSANAGASTLVDWELDTQPAAGGTWSPIASGASGVTNGMLGTLDTTTLSQGYHILRLTTRNSCGSAATAIAMVFVDRQFDSFTINAPANEAVVGGDVCVGTTIWDHCFNEYTVTYFAANGPQGPVDAANPVYNQTKINQTVAQWRTVVDGMPDGEYELYVAASDNCGHTRDESIRVTVDNTLPVTEISDPINCDIIPLNTTIEVIGTVTDDNLRNWTLEYTGGPTNGWVTIATGSERVVDDVLGTWNTAGLPACSYTLRLRATDRAIVNCNAAITHHSEFTVSVKLGNCVDNNHKFDFHTSDDPL